MPETPIPRAGGAPVDLAQTVVVALGDRASTRAGDHAALRELVARLSGVSVASVTLSQRCTQCGAAGHGPLRVGLGSAPDEPGGPGDSPAVWVSLSRAAGRLALAVTAAGAVGIDLESTADLAKSPVADVLLSDAEAAVLHTMSRAGATAAVGALWTTKEAVLKAAGVGLRVDPRDLTVGLDRAGATRGEQPAGPGPGSQAAGPAGRRILTGWPQAPFPLRDVHLLPVPAPAPLVATVAVVSAGRPRLVLL